MDGSPALSCMGQQRSSLAMLRTGCPPRPGKAATQVGHGLLVRLRSLDVTTPKALGWQQTLGALTTKLLSGRQLMALQEGSAPCDFSSPAWNMFIVHGMQHESSSWLRVRGLSMSYHTLC